MSFIARLIVALAIVAVLGAFGSAIGKGYSFGACNPLAGQQEQTSVLGVRMCRQAEQP